MERWIVFQVFLGLVMMVVVLRGGLEVCYVGVCGFGVCFLVGYIMVLFRFRVFRIQ